VRTADAVIIGGGCVGASALYHLAALGLTDVVLIESVGLGAGSTSKAAGGIRMQHDDLVNTQLALRSLAEFTTFEEFTGAAIDFKQVGYLFLLDNSADLASFTRAAAAQRELGIPTEVLDLDAVRAMVPALHTEDLLGATYCPWEGYAAPEAVVQGYVSAARRLGAKAEVGAAVLEVLTDEVGVCGVRTSDETFATRHVVVAAGISSGDLVRPLGFDLPVTALPRTIFYSSNDLGVDPSAPLVVDFSTSFYFHREGAGLVFAGRESDPAELSVPAMHRLPSIEDAAIESSWWGFYEMSPDHNAMIGTAPIDGLHYATGFSGHGFMQSPAVGEHLAETILGLPTSLDLSTMSADRFVDGLHRTESFVI
jgi:glycine/D-amino acid oxidase-like deaminating enzyme